MKNTNFRMSVFYAPDKSKTEEGLQDVFIKAEVTDNKTGVSKVLMNLIYNDTDLEIAKNILTLATNRFVSTDDLDTLDTIKSIATKVVTANKREASFEADNIDYATLLDLEKHLVIDFFTDLNNFGRSVIV